MLYFKMAFLEMKGRIVKTLILFAVFLVLFTGLHTALTLLQSAEEAKSSALKRIGASVTLDYADIEDVGKRLFTIDIIDRLSSVENVVGVNQSYADFATPINFQNSKAHSGKDPHSQEVQIENEPGFENNVILEGNIRTEFADAFRNGAAAVASGAYPTVSQPGALISRILAEQNDLSPDDEIVLHAYGKELELQVVGIYDTAAQFQVTSENIIGTAVFAYSPYNRIYVDIDSFSQLYGIDSATLPIRIYISSPVKVQETGEKIKSMDFDWNIFRLVNTTATEYSMAANSIESVSSLTKTFVVLFTLIISVVIVIVMSIWAEAFRYESGIWLSMGASKWRAILMLLVSTIIIAIPAVVVSVLSSRGLASLILRYQASAAGNRASSVRQFVTGVEMDTSIVVAALNASMNIFFFAVVAGSILLACILPSYAVLKLKPREILSKK